MSDLLATMKRASQRFAGAVADTGAKTMLKTDMVFLERDIKTRKQDFGIRVYDVLQSNSSTTTTAAATVSAVEIQQAFEDCQEDIRRLESKVNSKRLEVENIERSSMGAEGDTTGNVNNVASGMDDAEAPGIPS